ncbi:hypothetical protein CLERM_214 [Coxiella-like endosymbiont]|nr:hypothetical protein CLERM_214 [Coxiella-like endosymbiont]
MGVLIITTPHLLMIRKLAFKGKSGRLVIESSEAISGLG